MPRPDRSPKSTELTEPTESYEIRASFENGEFRLTNSFWEQFTADKPSDPKGTDRRAIYEGNVSLSPLVLLHEARTTDTLATFTDSFDP